MTSESINYPVELTQIADDIGRSSHSSPGWRHTLREAASELARLALSEATLRERSRRLESGVRLQSSLANQLTEQKEELTARLRATLAEVEELYEELDGFRHPHSRSTGRAGDPS